MKKPQNRERPLPTLAASVLPEQITQLNALAKARYTTKSALVREALAFYLAANTHFMNTPITRSQHEEQAA